ncbi:hypothetical protein H0H92_003343 [Tricholoma furcatifolium]|nr:hypothetical protein H0H92_003343 [Tricholoma furcatifolium]
MLFSLNPEDDHEGPAPKHERDLSMSLWMLSSLPSTTISTMTMKKRKTPLTTMNQTSDTTSSKSPADPCAAAHATAILKQHDYDSREQSCLTTSLLPWRRVLSHEDLEDYHKEGSDLSNFRLQFTGVGWGAYKEDRCLSSHTTHMDPPPPHKTSSSRAQGPKSKAPAVAPSQTFPSSAAHTDQAKKSSTYTSTLSPIIESSPVSGPGHLGSTVPIVDANSPVQRAVARRSSWFKKRS